MQQPDVPRYGKIIMEYSYEDFKLINTVRIVRESKKLDTKQELITDIIDQLSKLKDARSVDFEVHADAHTHEPSRIVVVSKEIV